DTHLGGDDYDRRVVDWLAEEFKKENGIDLKADRQALQRLTEAAERAKVELSTRLETTINLPFITADQTGPKHLEMALTRAKFEALTANLTERCRAPFMAALKDAGLTPQQISEVVLVGGATRMPAIQQLVKELTGGKEPHKGVNPDEVVAVGAAIQAGVLKGEVKDVLLLDVTPLSLGIETMGGVFTRLIERNTTIPTSRSNVFTTAADNQTSVEVHVVQGERDFARDNRTLGRFHLDGIPPAPRGMPQVEVTFDIDANGILNVKAQDKGTGREQSVTITASSTLSKDEVERLVKEAQAHAAEDRSKREEVELRNQADQMVYQAEKVLKENAERIPAEVKTDVEAKMEALKTASKGGDTAALRKAMDEFNEALQKVGQHIYQGAGAGGPDGQAPGSQEKPKEDVVDADYREVN
ncbi:MAG TPA: Hsp70 family protein, partial [Candidatus Dormibacteraeota bacterium]|nr:Hsp70 family protein [Candidatus Dormibacteraeota bacterium]